MPYANGSAVHDRTTGSAAAGGAELPRLLLLVRAALRAEGVEDPGAHLAVVQGGRVATVLMSRVPFEAAVVGLNRPHLGQGQAERPVTADLRQPPVVGAPQRNDRKLRGKDGCGRLGHA